eukprot:TRINITY_DN56651_c0_g1_i1.p1 TRINITY_DN56651_c0_g1~~TRINITY_DN56651_c0_g1_i1.p1  ORF type:complete len:278 (-),score=65.13 TRINITY_DN56651_c0_g1_i1:97-930(-)
MAAAQGPDERAMRAELREIEIESKRMQDELQRTQKQLDDSRRAGSAVLAAVEGAMAPLMAELAMERQRVDHIVPSSPRSDGTAAKGDALEVEIQHLKLDIEHYQGLTEQLQIEERKRLHMLEGLRSSLEEASEDLAYEKQRVRHHEVCRQLGLPDGGWVGLGPLGVGKRTLEARAEKKLRESAEERSARLAREVTRLAGDSTEAQITIEQLSRRLDKIRAMARTKDRRLASAAAQTSELHARLRGSPSEGAKDTSTSKVRSRKMDSASTGKLPQLSF